MCDDRSVDLKILVPDLEAQYKSRMPAVGILRVRCSAVEPWWIHDAGSSLVVVSFSMAYKRHLHNKDL